MTNYVTMQTRIADEIARADLSEQIKNAILSAIQTNERKGFYFNEIYDTFPTVAGQEWYSGAVLTSGNDIADIVEIDAMHILVAGDTYEMDARDYKWMDAVQSNSVLTGDPTDYAYYRQQIRLYPIPHAVRTVTVSYIQKFAALSADGDTNAWMTDAEPMIRAHAKHLLYSDVIRDDSGAQNQWSRYLQEKQEIEKETAKRSSSGRLRAWGY